MKHLLNIESVNSAKIIFKSFRIPLLCKKGYDRTIQAYLANEVLKVAWVIQTRADSRHE